jgi:hypothetical protein
MQENYDSSLFYLIIDIYFSKIETITVLLNFCNKEKDI